MVTLKTLLTNVLNIINVNIKYLNIIHLVKEKVPGVETKRLLLVAPYLGIISLQTRFKLQQVLKCVLNFCKLKIAFKCQTRLSNCFRYKDLTPKDIKYLVLFINLCEVFAMSPIMMKVSDT